MYMDLNIIIRNIAKCDAKKDAADNDKVPHTREIVSVRK
jgi:hypothetical protein